MRKTIVILLLCSLPFLQGCGVALLTAGIGYAIGQGRQGTAKLMEAKSKYLERYNDYKIKMEEINLEREKSGLEPKEIQTFEEWLDDQPLTPEEQKLFTKIKAQTPKEFKEQEEQKTKAKKQSQEEQQEPATNFSSGEEN